MNNELERIQKEALGKNPGTIQAFVSEGRENQEKTCQQLVSAAIETTIFRIRVQGVNR
jgi:hypothetical protein